MPPLLPLLNDAAAKWSPFVYHVTWQATLLAVLILAVVRLGRRWPSPLRYSLLVLALVKFALPPQLSMPTGLFTQMGPTVQAEPAGTNVPMAELADPGSKNSPTPWVGTPEGPPGPDPAPKRATPPVDLHPASVALDGRSWLMLLHVLGTLVAASWISRGLLAMRGTLRRASEVPDGELRRRYVRLSEKLGLRRAPRLLLSHERIGPAAFGVLRPAVILPDAVAQLESSALDAILAHELAHHRRRDPWINWVQLGLSAAWWFNPVLWVLNRQIRRVREDCCDDLLLTCDLTTGPAYCDTLLEAASRLTSRPAAGVSLMFGEQLHPMGRRFERIMDRSLRRAPRLSLAGILLLTLIAIVALPGLRRTEDAKASPPEKQAEPAAPETAADDTVAAPAAASTWPEGERIEGRVLDHLGAPIANAEVLLLGRERIIVDADRRNWFVLDRNAPSPSSTRTGRNGAFSITRKKGPADRLAVIARDPLFWVVPRARLEQRAGERVEIKLPPAGGLAIRCDLPSKPRTLPVMIELKSLDGSTWNADSLRFHESTYSLANPGETVFEHLPPGHYAVQRFEETRTDSNSVLMTGADRRLVQIPSADRVAITFDRAVGKPLSGQVRGLENVELRSALLTISHWGPEEVLGTDGKRSRFDVAFDVLPITSEGRFTTDPIPAGKYSARLFAVRASTPQLSGQSSDYSGEVSFTVPEQGDPPSVEIVAKPNRPPDLSKVTDLRLRVVDEQGAPLSRLEAMVHTADAGYGPWVPGRDGMVFLGGGSQYRGAEALEVLVRADGFAPGVARFAGKQRDKLTSGEAAITLRRGRKVELLFKLSGGMAWPKGVLPEAYFDDMQERVRMMRQPSNRRGGAVPDFNMLNLHEAGAGRFEFRLAEDTPRFHVAIHSPGFLQFFEAGPFTLADVKDGNLEIDVPHPATLDVSFRPGDRAGADLPFKDASLRVLWRIQGNSYLEAASASGASLTPRLELTDLAPGDYLVSVRTQPREESKPVPGTEINVGAFFDQRQLTLTAGQPERIEFHPTPFDPNAFRGTRTAVVKIRKSDGTPAQGRNASVTYFDGHYGAHTVFKGAVPATGEIVLTGLTDKSLPSSYLYPAYTVEIDNRRVGAFGFAGEEPTQQFEFFLPPSVGDMAPDLELTSLASGKTTRLSDFRGKVVFLEFWATWCGPCQEPMAKLNALRNEQNDAWKDRVALVPVGLDAESARVRSHVQQRGWTGLDHFWSGGEGGGDFEAPAARAFVVSGVPEAVLIGPDGRVLWRGHPLDKSGGQDLKARIEGALK